MPPQVINNSRGNDDADFQQKVRKVVMDGLKATPKTGYYDRVVKKQEDGEEG